MAVIVNRPFREGLLLRALASKPLPTWAADARVRDLGAAGAEVHRFASCGDLRHPATARVDHVRENMRAATGPLPDEAMRKRIATAVELA